MRVKNVISGLCLLGLLACGEDFSGYIYEPPEKVNEAFTGAYPEAEVILWRNRGKYDEVFFTLAGNACQAWYSKSGNWIVTETEVEGKEVPLLVTGALEQGKYAAWNREGKWKKREQPDIDPCYLLEVVKLPDRRWLGYTDKGLLFWRVKEKTAEEKVAPALNAFVEDRYGWVWKMETGKGEEGKVYMDILEDNRLKTVVFTSVFSWEYTSWPVNRKTLPELVKQVFRANTPAGVSIGWAEYRESISGNFYYLVGILEEGSQHVLCITAEGRMIPVGI